MDNMNDQSTATKEWTTDEIELLITLVKQNSEIYDQTKPGYLNMGTLDNCWQTIANTIQTKDVQACKNKWQILRGCYRTRRSGNRGSRKWPYYDALSFLDSYIGQRKTPIRLRTGSDDYFETVILDPNMDYEECSSFTIEESDSRLQSTSVADSSTQDLKRGISPTEIETISNYFKSKKSTSSIHMFLQSMEEDIAKLSPKGLRDFKREMLETLDKYLEAEGKDKI